MLDFFSRLDGGVPSNKLAYVYLIKNEEMGLYKIGFTEDLTRRWKELQRQSVDSLHIWVAWRCPLVAARAFESIMHEKYAWARTHGEWFRLDEETAWAMKHTRKWFIPAFNTNPMLRDPLPMSPFHTHLL